MNLRKKEKGTAVGIAVLAALAKSGHVAYTYHLQQKQIRLEQQRLEKIRKNIAARKILAVYRKYKYRKEHPIRAALEQKTSDVEKTLIKAANSVERGLKKAANAIKNQAQAVKSRAERKRQELANDIKNTLEAVIKSRNSRLQLAHTPQPPTETILDGDAVQEVNPIIVDGELT